MYDAKNTSAAHTQTAAQNYLIMAAKVAYDILFIMTLLTGISVTLSFAYGKDQLNLQGVHTAIIDGMSFLNMTESVAI